MPQAGTASAGGQRAHDGKPPVLQEPAVTNGQRATHVDRTAASRPDDLRRRRDSPVSDASAPYDCCMALERITVDPHQMGGLPCIRGMRFTVSMVLGQLAAGATIDELLAGYPYLEREDVLAALEHGAAIANERELPVARPS